MARIWQEGFEDGLPFDGYLEGDPSSNQINGISMSAVTVGGFPAKFSLENGRNSLSNKSLRMEIGIQKAYFAKVFENSYDELYTRCYFKFNKSSVSSSYDLLDTIYLEDTEGNILLSLYQENVTSVNDWAVYARVNGSKSKVADVTLSIDTWYKIDMYYKVNATTGAYELKVDDVSIISNNSLNTGTANIKSFRVGYSGNYNLGDSSDIYMDDIAVNDTTGSINNSWCGNGTIVSLKPKGAGNYSQWDTCAGYAKAESGTTTTNITITGHGLSTGDVIYNKTIDEYRIVTVVDANNLTVSTVTGQSENDIILMYGKVNTISNTIGTTLGDDKYCVLVGHNLESGDVIVNTTRSNAIRKVVYIKNNDVYVFYDSGLGVDYDIGQNIYTMTDGDSIDTFKFKPYAITNHYEAVSNNADPSPKYSYVESTTSNDIDTYDMEELVADKSMPSGANVVAISHNIYAQEAGAGSEIKPVFRISSTDYAGDTIGLSGGTRQYQKIYETSPATSTAWSVSEVDGLEAGVKVV